jgi:hypothetical protein
MVRPKASNENLAVALAFAQIVIVRESTRNMHSQVRVHRKGPRSLYALFCACVPELARNSKDPNPINRSAVTCIEFNKILQEVGLHSLRKRDRTPNGVKWTLKVQYCSRNMFHSKATFYLILHSHSIGRIADGQILLIIET